VTSIFLSWWAGPGR